MHAPPEHDEANRLVRGDGGVKRLRMVRAKRETTAESARPEHPARARALPSKKD